jgi:hydroxyacylglutathione hydrolase
MYRPTHDGMEITPNIQALRLPFKVPIAPGIAIDRFVYAYLLYGKTLTLIDTGVVGCERPIFDAIRSHGRDHREIGRIILTHSHPDHIGAACAIQKITGCPIMAHSAERAWIEDVRLQNPERPVPGFDTLVGGSVHLDRELRDGDWIRFEDPHMGDLQVLHTPGHSPGSLSLFMPEEGVLFSGDAIPVPGDLPVYEDVLASVQSIYRLRELAGIRVLLSSWDKPRKGEEVYRRMDRALAYLQKIHETVLTSQGSSTSDLMELTRTTAAALGLPPQVVNPLLARTFAANLRLGNVKNLLL